MCGKGTNTTTNQTSSSADPQAAQSYRDLLQRAQGVASTPYQAYTGELTAPVNAQQQLGVGNINSNASFAQPYVQQAAGIAGAAANPLTQQQIQQYQNPYTQSVVDATQAQFNRNNAQQQTALKGNTIASGALGGNREGIAQANLSSQQATQQNPIIAGLYANSYNQGVQTAGQQFQQNPLAAAGSLANFGISGQGAALSGAGAQLGAGTLQQQTQQQADTANYGQYQQAQAYPYQQTQWLAGLDTGVGSNLGGSSAGSTTGPAPNQTAQYAGLGLAAAGMFLNRGGRVGYADGGGVGELEASNSPYQIRTNGGQHQVINIQTGQVHYTGTASGASNAQATLNSRRYANGGVVPHMADGGMPGTPWSGGVGWIPQMNIHGGSGAPHASAPSLPSTPAFDPTKFASQLTSLGSKSGVGNAAGAFFNPEAYGASYTGVSGAGAYGGSSTSPLAGLSADDYGEGFHRGGVVGYAGGGAPGIDFTDPSWENPDVGPGIGPAGFTDRFAPAGENPFGAMPKAQGLALADRSPVINPNDPVRMPDQAAVDAWRAGTPAAPAARPSVQAKDDDDAELPTNATPAQGGPQSRGVASAGFTPPYPVDVPSGVVPSKEPGFGLGLISPNAKTGLLTAGLSMLASRSPNLGNAIGEGGLAGFGAYGSAEEHDRKVASEAQKLSTEAKKAANDLAQKTFTTNETSRHNKAIEANSAKDKVPAGYEQTKDGLRALPGGPADPEQISKLAKAKQGSGLTDTAKDIKARQMISGDMSWATNLGRGAQAGKTLEDVSNHAAQILTDEGGMSTTEAASHMSKKLQEFRASGIYKNAEARTAAGREANLNLILNATEAAIPAALDASKAVARTGWVPINKIIQKGEVIASNPELKRFGMANLQLAEHWARAMNPLGVMRESDRDMALNYLNTADSQPTYAAAVDQLHTQILRERDAVRKGSSMASPNSPALPLGATAARAPSGPPTIVAIDMLLKNPALAPQFDQRYGAGASRQYLGQR